MIFYSRPALKPSGSYGLETESKSTFILFWCSPFFIRNHISSAYQLKLHESEIIDHSNIASVFSTSIPYSPALQGFASHRSLPICVSFTIRNNLNMFSNNLYRISAHYVLCFAYHVDSVFVIITIFNAWLMKVRGFSLLLLQDFSDVLFYWKKFETHAAHISMFLTNF